MPELFLDLTTLTNLQPPPVIRFVGDLGPPFYQVKRIRLNPQVSGPIYRPTRFEREEVI
jgi:hypothetical protein